MSVAGFELVEERHIPEINSLARRYRHIKTGARLLSIENDDENKLFCIAFATPPERAMFVGDSSIDAATARAANLPVWLLSHGYNMGQPVAACRPDRVFDDFASLRAALGLAPVPVA